MSRLVLLDNEAVQALGRLDHPKHRRVLGHVEVVAQRKRRALQVFIAVPTTVRVEAGWDRTAASWALANHLRIGDENLDGARANTAATIRKGLDVSVADAHLGAVVRMTPYEAISVLTSDPTDISAAAGNRAISLVAL